MSKLPEKPEDESSLLLNYYYAMSELKNAVDDASGGYIRLPVSSAKVIVRGNEILEAHRDSPESTERTVPLAEVRADMKIIDGLYREIGKVAHKYTDAEETDKA